MERFYKVVSDPTLTGPEGGGLDEADARKVAAEACKETGNNQYVLRFEVIAEYTRPEPQVVEHNLVRRHKKAEPKPETVPEPVKAKKTKKGGKDGTDNQ